MEGRTDALQIRSLLERLVQAWESGDVSSLKEMILPNAWIDFSMFERGISVKGLEKEFSVRARKTDFIRFELYNYVGMTEKKKGQQAASLIGIFADPNDGQWTRYAFEGSFANSLCKTEAGWKFSAIRFELQDESSTPWARIYSDGIHAIPGSKCHPALGDRSFIANWRYPDHDIRIGWFPDRRLPPINAELDAPWNAISNRDDPGTDEEQIQEVFFRYAYGVDYGCFNFYKDVFTEDAMMIYSDEQPYELRSVIDMLKLERQGSCRCLHTGYFTQITINGDKAVAHLRLRMIQMGEPEEITEELIKKYLMWSRYRLEYHKVDGQWRIHRLNFYPGPLESKSIVFA